MLSECVIYINDQNHQHIGVPVSKDIYNYWIEAQRYEWRVETKIRRHAEQLEMTDNMLYRSGSQYHSMEDDYYQHEQATCILQALMRLCSEKQRRRFVRHFLDGVSQTEIAREEGCCRQAVSQSIAKAIQIVQAATLCT